MLANLLLLAAAAANHENLNATLWTQTAVEHDAICLQAFRQARESLDRALKDKRWTAALEQTGNYRKLPPAVVLDIDETVVDNSGMEARAALADSDFTTELWDQWVSESAAGALPGAVEFTQYARSRGVTVFFITNRDAKHEEATRKNLARLGFPLDPAKGGPADTLLTRGERPEWTSDKGTRRAEVASRYRILLLLGDDFGDFVSNVRVPVEQRRAIYQRERERWGRQWFVLPNPMYGSWEAAVLGPQRLKREDALSVKFKSLRTKGDPTP